MATSHEFHGAFEEREHARMGACPVGRPCVQWPRSRCHWRPPGPPRSLRGADRACAYIDDPHRGSGVVGETLLAGDTDIWSQPKSQALFWRMQRYRIHQTFRRLPRKPALPAQRISLSGYIGAESCRKTRTLCVCPKISDQRRPSLVPRPSRHAPWGIRAPWTI